MSDMADEGAKEEAELRETEQAARAVYDFLLEYGWQKIMADGNLNATLFTKLFRLGETLKKD